MQKKTFMMSIMMILMLFLCSCGVGSQHSALKVNWNISVPTPQKTETVYSFDFREGSDFEKWYYDDADYKSITDNKEFTMITEENMSCLEECISYQYEALTDKEKALFESQFLHKGIVGVGDYFLRKAKDPYGNYYEENNEDAKTGILLYLDSESRVMYYFLNVW